jgi:hypothetical protein
MIELINIENKIKLGCEIVGYEFLDRIEDNWLLLKVKVEQEGMIFEKIDATLTTTELIDLYEWFKCLAENRLPQYAHLTFTEPCISFNFLSYQNNRVRISIELSHELKPDFEIDQFKTKSIDWNIVFDLDSNVLEKTIVRIGATMNRFPIRGKS